jgi:hypothetical protein
VIPEGWNLDTLYVHLSRMIEDLEKRQNIAILGVERTAAATAAAAKEATIKSEESYTKRFDAANETKALAKDAATLYASRSEMMSQKADIDRILSDHAARLGQIEGAGRKSDWGYLVAAITLICLVATLAATVLSRGK